MQAVIRLHQKHRSKFSSLIRMPSLSNRFLSGVRIGAKDPGYCFATPIATEFSIIVLHVMFHG